MYKWISVTSSDSYQELALLIDPVEYGAAEVASWLKEQLNGEVGGVLVEYPYVDKDYRSTYYHYYAKKGSAYSANCVRLHFFKHGWSLVETPATLVHESICGLAEDKHVAQGYLGYMVLRPTRRYTIGRSLLSPQMMAQCKGRLIEHVHKCHVMGYRVHVSGFPFMQQHSDIAVCAHIACWSILRHYSERYSLYPEVLLHDVALKGRDFEPGGLLPSLGLTPRDAEKVFAVFGTYPLLVHGDGSTEDRSNDVRFFDELLAYLESGFPLFGVQSRRGHAVSIVGFLSSPHCQTSPGKSLQRAWDYVSHLLVVDDNFAPYLPIARVGKTTPYLADEIDGFIVPLPEKVFLPAGRVIDYASELLRAAPEGFSELEGRTDLVSRCFVTTTASWHRYIRQQCALMPAEFVSASLELPMPQFIWVVEVATEKQRAKGEISARLILDATAGPADPFPAFLLHDACGALWLDQTNREPLHFQPFVSPIEPLREMASNLSNRDV